MKAEFTVRRANVDDMPRLGPLLKATHLPAAELEKRFTEFQVVEKDGQLVAALGLLISQKHGKIHSETYTDFSLSDTLRPMLWERLQRVAQNYGLIQLWTQETAPYWKHEGFAPADEVVKAKFPSPLGDAKESWLTLKLREDPEKVLSLDHEFALFMESEKARTEEMMSQAKVFKGLAWVLAVTLLIFVAIGAIVVFKKKHALGLP